MSSSSTPPIGGDLTLPDRPDLHHLKEQARELLASGGAAKLSEAQYRLARRYGFASWPRLKAHVESLQETGRLKAAIDADDLAAVQQMMTANPALHRAPLGYNNNGPLTWVAECLTPRQAPSPARLEMARWMLQNGSDVQQGGDGPLMRAALRDDRIPMMELLVAHGADVNALWNGHYPILFAPCETLQPNALRWLLDHDADPQRIPAHLGNPIAMLVGTYSRNSVGRHACLEVFARAVTEEQAALLNTPTLALHRGRIDLLEAHLRRDASLMSRLFSEAEVFPPELGLKPGDGLMATLMAGGVTLLHLAAEYDDVETARWLLDHRADVNARARPDADGFGDQTPLFHTAVMIGRSGDTMARLLLERGADPNARATLRRRLDYLPGEAGERTHEFRSATPLGYARGYPEPTWANAPALAIIAQYEGKEE